MRSSDGAERAFVVEINGMQYLRLLWDDEDDLRGNMQHVLDHGLSIEDVGDAMAHPAARGTSKSSGLPCVWGYTRDGTYAFVVYEQVEEDSARVVTAYVPEPP